MLAELRLLQVHDVLTALRGGAHQEHPADEGGSIERDLLGDHAAQREAEQIDLGEAERIGEDMEVLGHPGDGGGYLSGRAS